MIIGKSLYTQLKGDTPTNAIVAGRIFPVLSPEQGRAYPEIVYEGDEGEFDQTFDGPGNLVTQQVKVNCRDRSYDAAMNLGTVVNTALNGQSGTWAGIKILGVFYKGEEESDEAIPNSGPDSLVYIKTIHFSVVYRSA